MTLPNQLTILRMVLTPIFIFFLLFDMYYSEQLATFVFLIASLTDWYDGYVARRYGFVSKWGKFLDPLADKVLISSALISFWILRYIQLWVVMVIIFTSYSYFSTYASPRARSSRNAVSILISHNVLSCTHRYQICTLAHTAV